MKNGLNARGRKLSLLLGGLFWLALTSLLFFQAVEPIGDPDFWWHLKTGEAMIQKGGLLQSDPFTFQSNAETTTREASILKGYWLWEISAYSLYKYLNLNGILLLKFITITAIAAALALQIRRQRIMLGIAAPLLIAGFLLLDHYGLERPQIFSFFFAILLVGMLSSVRQGGRLGLGLPIVMCLWANVHGGVVVGNLILLCFVAGVAIEYRRDLSRMKHLLLWTIAGVAASLINPNGWSVYTGLINFHDSNLMIKVTEYTSTWEAFAKGDQFYAILWLLVILYFVAVAVLRQVFWPEFLIAIFLAYFSIKYTRNAPFFALAILPIIARSWQEILQKWVRSGLQSLSFISATVAIFAILWLTYIDWGNWQPGIKMRAIYPEAAINFLQENGFQGRMFNSYEYGGYLLWRLAPESKVFIDGRGIDPKVFADYEKITNARVSNANGQKGYESILDSYKIDYVIQPIYDGLGNTQPLMKALLPKADWKPIYLDKNVYILARPVRHNKNIIEAYQIDKNEFKNRLLLIYNYLHRVDPEQIGYRVAKAGMLIYMGHYEDAQKEVDAIKKAAPNDESIPLLLRDLYVLAGKRARAQEETIRR